MTSFDPLSRNTDKALSRKTLACKFKLRNMIFLQNEMQIENNRFSASVKYDFRSGGLFKE